MKKTDEIKLMIIENFIDHFTTNEEERDQMKKVASTYVEEDWVDEIEQAGFTMKPTKEMKEVDNALMYGSFKCKEDPDETDDTYERGIEVIKQLKAIEDKGQMMESTDLFQVAEAFEWDFTVKSFLNHIVE